MNRTVLVIVFLLAVVLPLVFGACVTKRCNVVYESGKFGFTNAKDSYPVGRRVELYYDLIATDTDYSFYVDGADYDVRYDDKKGYVISFVMPDHDVIVGVTSRNTMEYEPEDGRNEPEDEGNGAENPEPALALSIDGAAVPVVWEDNESVRELLDAAREGELTVTLSAYGGFEQVGPLGRRLTRNDVRIQTAPGDIVLYSGNQIVVFYGSNMWEYTRLGRIELTREELTALLAKDSVSLTIAAED